ncbi:MAG: TetR/AcrR family transcriptional regulator [Lewinellaceae bacterium]|nr:TetR/AcrR family transcriptional regulator [Lewinella sp.]MCB9277667.1 TetR/AcrR family transcriptional regulator [Lewinellaceae bacterium]
MQKDHSTEQKIKDAARLVFLQKGYAGARMEEIAAHAGITKAMLHYYFRSKEKLFEVIFDEVFRSAIPRISTVLTSDLDTIGKIEAFVDAYIGILMENPHVPIFILHELNSNPERFVQKIKEKHGFPDISVIFGEIMNSMMEGKIRAYHPFHLLMNVLGMCIFPFAARPMLKAVGGMDEAGWAAIMADRAAEVKRFIRAALVI